MRQLRVGALGDVAVGSDQARFLGEIKAWVSAQEFREIRERAPTTRLPDELVHLRANALHLRKADFVNLLGGQRGGRVPADKIGVNGLAAGQRVYRDRFPTGRDVGLD